MVKTIQAGPMEFFLLAVVSRGSLNTLYALQRAVGLQPGSLSQVVNRLEKHRLLVRSAGGKRRRRTMSLTEAGEGFLEREWRNCLDPHREMESVLRSATVAVLMGDARAGFEFLLRCATERHRHQVRQEAGAFSPQSTAIDLHGAMRAAYESRRWAMEAQVLEEMGKKLAEFFKDRKGSR